MSVCALAQTDSLTNQVTDRPTQSFSAHTVSRGTFQVETGFSVAKTQLGVSGASQVSSRFITFNTTQLRYGISDKVEMRFSQDLIRSELEFTNPNFEEAFTAVFPSTIGLKIHLFDSNDRGRPQTSVMLNYGGPIFTDIVTGSQVDFRFNMENRLSDKLTLGYNVGGIFFESFTEMDGIVTAVLSYTSSEKLSFYGELYGIFNRFSSFHLQSDFGIVYSLSPNFQVDVFGGLGISEITPDTLFGGGLSFRIPGK